MQKKRTFLAVVLICLGAFLSTGEAEGSTMPELKPVETLETLVNWYESEAGGNSSALLKGDLAVEAPLIFSETDTIRDIGAPENVIYIESGGILILDNPNLVLQGPKTVVIVKNGGQLQLRRGAIYTGPGQAIIVEKGGTIIRQTEFQIIGGEIYNENEEDSVLPPTIIPPPEQEGRHPITNVIGNSFDIFCSVGERPEKYPEIMTVAYEIKEGVHGQLKLPIYWQLEHVDFQTPGTYEVTGSFAQEDLAAQGLTNPQNLGAVLRITVQKSAPIDSMTGRFVRIGAQGNALVQLKLPALPGDATALYLYRSDNGERWEQVGGKNPEGEFTNFLQFSQQQGLYSYVNYRYRSDYRDIWMKVQVVGSDYEGFSNAVCIQIPDDARPGTVVNPGSDPEDGSFDGNRGGGGQQETERIVPAVVPDHNKASAENKAALQQASPAEDSSDEAKSESAAGSKSDRTSKPVSKTASKAQSESKAGHTKGSSDTRQESRGIWPVAAVTLGVLAGAALLAAFACYKKKSNTGKPN